MAELQITGGMIVLFFVIFTAIGGVWFRIEARFKQMDNEREKVKNELAEYKVFVANNHVSSATLREMEQRLIKALDRLADRLELIADNITNKRGGERAEH